MADTQADKTSAARLTAEEAQIQTDQRAAAEDVLKTPIVVVGAAGGPFNIRDENLGGSKGTLTIGGHPCPISAWGDGVIKGLLPTGVKGAVVLQTSLGTRTGVFPTPHPKVVTTTTVATK